MKKSVKSQEIADRVKEIKQRQHNWMKERAANKGNEDLPSKSLSAHSAPNSLARKSGTTAVNDHHKSSFPLPTDVLSSKKSNAKFQNWLKAREGKDNTEHNDFVHHSYQAYNSRNYSNNIGKGHDGAGCQGDVNILSISSSRSPQYATPDLGWNSDDETGEITAAQLMDPEDFDAVADDIIARVKGDLSLKGGTRKQAAERGGGENDGSKLSSHICPNCENLMLPTQHNPMLVIPCGHTVCRTCSKKTKYCCICGCPAQSAAENTGLQHIITDFQSQERAKKEEKQRNRKLYKEEYHNLRTRQEILQQESVSIFKNISKLTSDLNKEKQQIESITKEEESIQRKIRALQQQSQVLGEHRREYERNFKELENQTESENKRLVLVKNSLKSVKEQIEKVKLLAESNE